MSESDKLKFSAGPAPFVIYHMFGGGGGGGDGGERIQLRGMMDPEPPLQPIKNQNYFSRKKTQKDFEM